jgi:membrane-bound lytic murein transglycosylase B
MHKIRKALLALCLTSGAAHADFNGWLADFKHEARARGISQSTLDAAFINVQPQPRVLELDLKQPEFVDTFATYLAHRVTAQRIARGRSLLIQYQSLFDRVEQRYGVSRYVLAALWGLETNYGSFTGNAPIPEALATLAYDGRRSDFFRNELFDALHIIDSEHLAVAEMKGSWAGAMGQMQFMPSTWRRYAIDGDDDQRINLWTSLPDALSSAANYLHQAGWQSGAPAMLELHLPSGFDWRYARPGYRRPLAAWRAAGVTLADGTPLIGDARTAIILPQGWRGPAFMVFDNFDVVMQWNRSVNYALAIAILAQRLQTDAPLPSAQDAETDAMSRAQMMTLQAHIGALGYAAGTPDGLPGIKTQSAIRRFQAARHLPVDGYASPSLLTLVEASFFAALANDELASPDGPGFSEDAP